MSFYSLMKPPRATLITLAALLMACNFLWNALNRDSLQTDVAEVLAYPEAGPLDLACQMVGSTRTGYCLFEAEAQVVEHIASYLGLEGLEASAPMLAEGQTGCLASEELRDAEDVTAYGIDGRPAQLALSSGGQFEYLLLLHHSDTGQVCVQVSYAYG